ncbi:hypothetical protein [Streptomyces sp. NPDC058665]|uniref:hypothetical protein n=1 Tax=Streptomyces sp. NPDC058665 TaxID=3346586 RepID=UPI003668D611
MAAKKMVEYSVSVPAECTASVSLNHSPGSTVCTIECKDAHYHDWSRREFVLGEAESHHLDTDPPEPAEA